MMDKKELQFNNWMKADPLSRKELLLSLEGYKGHDFKLKTVQTFNSNQKEFTTGIYELGGEEYLFVPGNRVVLGWDEANPVEEAVLAALQYEMDIAGIPMQAQEYLKEVCSPIREVEISPMLVERNVRLMNSYSTWVNYNEVIRDFDQQGFSMVTEDEWEYLCGAELGALFSLPMDSWIHKICSQESYFWNTPVAEQPNAYGLQNFKRESPLL
ncbi:hypothetical protein GCM10010912_35100 [Paenibacillus albidus]|uniref:Formylglycine-generating enzyme family protein n=1 Tax=Paenibacillus albidus TaxID=2041023 RepID=A0A917FI99_9BACL|nr:hypothetical protein [Paenibacillus albidus]GGF86800.1 hypothetical protein GCM10010912_35100 [Paenibacillus albidus]